MSKLSKLIHKIPGKMVLGLVIMGADTALQFKGIHVPVLTEIGAMVVGVGAWSKLEKGKERGLQILDAVEQIKALAKKPTVVK